MADSERLSAPGCWLACTSFSSTKKGILLFAEIILCLVILICFSASTTSAYSSLSVIEMICAAVLLVFYTCDLHSKISFINWPWTDFFRSLIATILYLITSIVVLVEGRGSSRVVAGVRGPRNRCKVWPQQGSFGVKTLSLVRHRSCERQRQPLCQPVRLPRARTLSLVVGSKPSAYGAMGVSVLC